MLIPKGNAQDAGILGATDVLDTLVTGGPLSLGDESRHHYDLRLYVPKSLPPNAHQHLALQSPHLVQDVHYLHNPMACFEARLKCIEDLRPGLG